MFNFATGQPLHVSYLYEGDFNGTGEFFGRPDIIGNPQAAHSVNPQPGIDLLNAAAFAAPCTIANVGGTEELRYRPSPGKRRPQRLPRNQLHQL